MIRGMYGFMYTIVVLELDCFCFFVKQMKWNFIASVELDFVQVVGTVTDRWVRSLNRD